MKRYDIQHCKNLRDIGGCPVPSGYVPYGRFFRSDQPYELSNDECKLMNQLKITTVIDLRYQEEVKRKPCAFATLPLITYRNISLGVGTLPMSESAIPLSYLDYIENKEAMCAIFSVLADAPGAVLFHCAAGKDRTGVVAALLLLLAGAKTCDIIADYQVSYIFIKEIIDQLKSDNPDLPAFAGQSKAEYMDTFLNLFHQKYPDIQTYLKEAGLSAAQIYSLSHKLK